MDHKELILKALKDAKKPLSQKEVEMATGLDSKLVDKAFKELKKEEKIISPIRCKWEPKLNCPIKLI